MPKKELDATSKAMKIMTFTVLAVLRCLNAFIIVVASFVKYNFGDAHGG
jgi:hypothetical protein